MKHLIGILVFILSIVCNSAAQWIGPQRLTFEPGRSETTVPSNVHCIACNGRGKVYVVYTRDTWTDTSEVYIKISTDDGITWLPEQRITNAVNEKNYPSIALDTLNRVHVVWMDKRDGVGWQVYYKRSTDGGSSWQNPIRISLDNDYSQSPSVATDGANEVYVVWYDSVGFQSHEIFFRKSATGGFNWGSEVRISYSLSVADYPTIAFEQPNNIHIAWDDGRNGNRDIYYRRSTDRGISWGPETQLISYDTLGQTMCSIDATSSGWVHLAWRDARDSQFLLPRVEIYSNHSTDSGSNWLTDTRLTNNTNDKMWPNIAADDFGGVHIVYQESSEIMYLYSSDGGTTWEAPLNISNDPAVSMHPFVAVDSFVHVVWSDDRDGNFEIYYNRTSLFTGIEEVTDFTAVPQNGCVILRWRTEVEKGSYEWLLQRKEKEGEYITIVSIDAQGNASYPTNYRYEDRGVEFGNCYFYRLVGVDIHSNVSYYGPLFVDLRVSDYIPQKIFLCQNFPNPFREITNIRFGIPVVKEQSTDDGSQKIGYRNNKPYFSLRIYDVSGRKVRTLIYKVLEPGYHNVIWDGKDDECKKVKKGVYFYRLSAENKQITKKMILAR